MLRSSPRLWELHHERAALHLPQDAYQRCLDRADQLAALTARIALSLQFNFLAACNGVGNTVSYVQRAVRPGSVATVQEQPIAEAVKDALDYHEPIWDPARGAEDSECPYIRRLKVAMAECIARDRAPALAELEVRHG